MKFYLSLIFSLLVSVVAHAEPPVVWNGTTARWLPSGLKSAGVCTTNSSGVQSVYTTNGILKLSAGTLSSAVSGTDYAPATSGTAILKGNGSGGFANAAAGTDYVAATSGSAIQKANGSGGLTAATSGTDYAPATSGTAILKGNGSGGFASAASGTDYAPATSGSAILKGSGSGGFSNASAGTDYEVPLTASGGVTRSTNDFRLSNMAAHTIKGNNTGSSAAPSDLTASQVATELDGLFVDSVGTIDSQSKSANGAVMTAGGQLILQTATPGFPGMVSDSTQTFTGAKTFTSAPIFTAGAKFQETTGSGNNKVTITEPEDIASDFNFPLPVSDATTQDGTMFLTRTSTGTAWRVPSGGGGSSGGGAEILHKGFNSYSSGCGNFVWRYGSTKITNGGSDISVNDSSTNGTQYTLSTAGTYAITWGMSCQTGGGTWAIMVDDPSCTTDPTSQDLDSGSGGALIYCSCTSTGVANSCSVTRKFSAGKVITFKTNVTSSGPGNTALTSARIYKVSN